MQPRMKVKLNEAEKILDHGKIGGKDFISMWGSDPVKSQIYPRDL